MCDKMFELQEPKVHLLLCQFCQDCARYETLFKMHSEENSSKCSHQDASTGPQWQERDAFAGPQWWHQWQEEYDEEQYESAWESYTREQENFKPRANEQRAPSPIQKPQEPAPLDVYAILRISPQSFGHGMKRAIRDRRIETHPGKRRRQGPSKEQGHMINEEAKLAGWVADIVLNPEKRRKHHEQVQAWRMSSEQ